MNYSKFVFSWLPDGEEMKGEEASQLKEGKKKKNNNDSQDETERKGNENKQILNFSIKS